MEMTLLTDIVVIFGLSMVILIICHRLRIPTIVGFLLSGILAGPYRLGLVKAVHEVELLAEVGVVLLLFTIGIEFSLKRLLQIRRSVLIGGSLQVLLTILVTFVLIKELGQATGPAIFIGFLIALSSTAIVLRQLQDSAQVDSPHGRTILSFFFVSIGMLLNVGLLIDQPGRALLIALGIIVLKALIASLATIILGKTLAESNIRREFGVNILAVRRGAEVISNPEPEIEFVAGDLFILLGKQEDIVRLMEYIDR